MVILCCTTVFEIEFMFFMQKVLPFFLSSWTAVLQQDSSNPNDKTKN